MRFKQKPDVAENARKNKLYELRKKVGAPSVRKVNKAMADVEKVQHVMDLKESDVLGNWGVTQVKARLANDGILLTR